MESWRRWQADDGLAGDDDCQPAALDLGSSWLPELFAMHLLPSGNQTRQWKIHYL
jgi:hypothetical protein